MPHGGSINVSCRNIILNDETTLPLKKGRYVEISIKDAGMGIKKEDLVKIFGYN